MKVITVCVFFFVVSTLRAQEVSCPATRQGKRLADAMFFEWTTLNKTRAMATDRKALEADESRIEGGDWFQRWDVKHATEGNGLQLVCEYLGLPAGLFIEVNSNISTCSLTKKSGVVKVLCK